MNTDILVEKLSDNNSNPEESNEKENEEEIDNETSQMVIRPEYSMSRINEIAPRISAIMQGGSHLQKNFDKIEANLFDKIFKCMRKVIFYN